MLVLGDFTGLDEKAVSICLFFLLLRGFFFCHSGAIWPQIASLVWARQEKVLLKVRRALKAIMSRRTTLVQTVQLVNLVVATQWIGAWTLVGSRAFIWGEWWMLCVFSMCSCFFPTGQKYVCLGQLETADLSILIIWESNQEQMSVVALILSSWWFEAHSTTGCRTFAACVFVSFSGLI